MREGGREGEGGCCCRLKKQKSCLVLFHRKTLGLEETQGSRASHQLPICHSLTALSNTALSRLYQWSKTMKWQTSPPACLSTGTPGSAHTPQGPTLFFSPVSLLFLLCSFFFHHMPDFFFSPFALSCEF